MTPPLPPVTFACPSCQAGLEIDGEHAGWRVRCPGCQSTFLAGPEGTSSIELSRAPSPLPTQSGAPSAALQPPATGAEIPTPATRWPETMHLPGSPQTVPPAAQASDHVFASPIASNPGAPTYGPATLALVLGILSVSCFGWLAAIPAIVIGIKARKTIRASQGALAGDNLALGAIVLAIAGAAMSFLDMDKYYLVNFLNRKGRVVDHDR